MATPKQYTLLDLVQIVNQFANNDEEVVATVTHPINSGKVRLCGNFAGAKIDLSPSPRTPRSESSGREASYGIETAA